MSMNVPTILAALFAALTIGSGVVAYRQHATLDKLRLEAASERTAAESQTNRVRHVAVSTNRTPAGQLSESDKLEMLKLRGEVTRLRQQARDLGGIRKENEQLRANLKTGPGTAGGGLLPQGYVRRRDAQFAGAGSPEATLQSMLWAIEHKDTNALFSLMDEDAARRLREGFAREGAEEFWKQAGMVPGWRIVGTEAVSDDEVTLKVEILPGETTEGMRLKRVGNDWKFKQ